MWVGIGSLSSSALAIVSAAILSRYFDKHEYGTYKQILYVYNSLLIIFSAGLPKVFSYFLPRYSKEEGRNVVFKLTSLLFLLGIIFSIFLFGFSDSIAKILKNPELKTGLRYFSIIPIFWLPTLGLEGIFSTYKKTVYIAIYNTLSRLLMLLFIVGPVILWKGSYLYAIFGWGVVSILSFFIAIYFKNIPFKKIKSAKAQLSVKEIFSYSLPLVGASIAGLAISSSYEFYISRFFGTTVFAEYSNGFTPIPLVGMVTVATSAVLMPQFAKMVYEKENVEKLLALWRGAVYKSAVLIYPIVIFVFFNAKPIIIFLYSSAYANSVIYFRIAIFTNFLNIVVFAPLLLSLGESKFYSRIHWINAFLAWTGGFLIVKLIPKAEFIAAFSVILNVLMMFFSFPKISRILGVRIEDLFPFKKIMIILLHSGCVIAVITFINLNTLHPFTELITLIIKAILYVLLLISTQSFFKIDYLVIFKSLIAPKKNKIAPI